MAKDDKIRTVKTPEKLRKLLKKLDLLEVYEEISFTPRKEFAQLLKNTKTPETFQRRLNRIIADLLKIVTPKKANEFIDKLALIHIDNKKLLTTMSRDKDVWYIPGGKREKGESDEQALIREVKEELNVDLEKKSIKHYGTFLAQAHGKPKGVLVRMTCFTAKFDGELKPTSEIEKLAYLESSTTEHLSPVDYIILDDLFRKRLIA